MRSLPRMCISFCILVPAGPHFLESVEFCRFRRTHVGIKSFQGKINFVQNPTESGIPAGIPEGRTLDMVFCATCNKHSLRRHGKNVNDGILLSAAAAIPHCRKPLLLPPLLPLLEQRQ